MKRRAPIRGESIFASLLIVLASAACGEKGGGGGSYTPADIGSDAGVDAAAPDFGPPPAQAEVFASLPVEVLGPAGTAAAVEIELSESMATAETAELHLRVANVVAVDSAVVWINDEHRYDLSGDESPFLRPAGGWADGSIDLDPAHLVSGINTLTFEYTRQIPAVVGFRVLAAGVEAGGESADGPTTWEDPATWEPITTDPEALERGRAFFQEASRDEPTCATCHTFTGADLAYYAFSNRSIVARAMLAGFDRTEAEEIASYIRTLEVDPEGRPWVGPFQPGPDNFAAAGAGMDAVAIDAEVLAAYANGEMPEEIAWDHPADLDPFLIPSSVQTPTWHRWLPREIDRGWFERRDGELQSTFRDLEVDGSLESAHAFMTAAVAVGEELAAEGDHASRVDLLRFAAVQLWDWSRRQSFYEDHHGFPNDTYGDEGLWGSPAYPYEVGVALFEASDEPGAMRQAAQWWIAQMAVDFGRGRSNGSRPLNYRDVLEAAEPFVGPAEVTWIYLLGSWEESRGPLENSWGEGAGPVRLLEVALPYTRPEWLFALWARHMDREAAYSQNGGRFSDDHVALLELAWARTCADLEDNAREQLVARTPDELRDGLACP